MPRRPVSSRALITIGATALALAATLTAPFSGVSAAPQEPTPAFAPALVTVDTPTRADKQRLQALGLDLTEHAGHDYVEVVLHSAGDLATLTGSGLGFDVRIPDLRARALEVADLNAAYAASTTRSPLPSGRTDYRTLADYEADMTSLERRFPRLVEKFRLPRPSLDGRPVHGIEIAANVARKHDGRPTFLLVGLHHAREWPSGENAIEFAFDLAQGFGRNQRITRLLRKGRVVVVPVVNVDGFHLSRTDGDLVDLRALNPVDPLGGTTTIIGTPGRAYMRKNCRVVDGQDTPDGTCAAVLASPGGFGTGVDLNRNYGGFWGGPGASDVRAEPTYRGASAFSEPETQNIRDLVRTRQVTMLISNHTFSNLILRPNGVHPETIGSDGKPVGDAPDEAALKRLGAQMAAQNGYQNIHGWELYDTTGTTEDWSYNATGGFGYTFEIGAHEFHPPYPQVIDEYLGAGPLAGRGNRAAYLIALEHAVDPRASGRLVGRAPRGAVLRLSKSFRTPTWDGSFADRLTTQYRVRRDGRVDWLVNPSTRPIVRSRTPGTVERYTLTCSVGGTVRQRSTVLIDRGQVRRLDLTRCARR